MNTSNVLADINTGCLTEVVEAAGWFYSEVRGLTVRQQFFIYPNDSIVCLNHVDGGCYAIAVEDDDEAIFRHRYSRYFS